MKAIVTVKLVRDIKHNPYDKKTGKCPLAREFFDDKGVLIVGTCTDVTGSHHSYLETGDTLQHIKNKARAEYGHVTRVEVIDE